MANIRPYYDKDGNLKSYQIRVFKGRDENGKQLSPFKMTFHVHEGWSESTAFKKATAAAAVFEEQCRAQIVVDSNYIFSQYAKYVINLKKNAKQIKYSTYVRYNELLRRINPVIGYLKLKDLRPMHLNDLYEQIKSDGTIVEMYLPKPKLGSAIKKGYFGPDASPDLLELKDSPEKISRTKVGKAAGVAQSTVGRLLSGYAATLNTAERVSAALGYDVGALFTKVQQSNSIADKTVLEHHRLISSILAHAKKENLISVNVAENAVPPKAKKKPADYYEPEVIIKTRDAIANEPCYWRAIAYLIIYTGARRGEILGLRNCDLDPEGQRVHIVNNLQYQKDIGIYIETPKTDETRWVAVPSSVFDVISEYNAWKEKYDISLCEDWADSDLLFITPYGKPFHPDSVTDWFSNLERKYGLPHLHPHAFRHSIASILIFNQVDIVSVAAQLGHADPATTEKIYAHVLKAAEKKNANIITSVLG